LRTTRGYLRLPSHRRAHGHDARYEVAPPVSIALELRRLNGQALHCELPFADEVSALVLKAFATNVRVKDTDIGDIWRRLEIANAAGLGPVLALMARVLAA
jgi:hypothetical protein